MKHRNLGGLVIASRRQSNHSHGKILREVISVKKWIKQKHTSHELPDKGNDETRISTEPMVSPEGFQGSQAFNGMNQMSLSQCSRLNTTTFRMVDSRGKAKPQ